MTQNKPTDPEPTLPPAVIASAIIGAVVLVAASLDESRSFGTWLHEYQTLITGVLAVIAAFATIWQMRVSDAFQEHRHRQLRYDAIKGDIRAVRRFWYFLPSAAREHAFDLRAYVDQENSSSANPFGSALGWHHALLAVERLRDALQDFRVTSCFDFLTPEIFQLLDDCKREAEAILLLERTRKGLDLHDPDVMAADEMYRSAALQKMDHLETKAVQVSELAGKWAADFLMDPTR